MRDAVAIDGRGGCLSIKVAGYGLPLSSGGTPRPRSEEFDAKWSVVVINRNEIQLSSDFSPVPMTIGGSESASGANRFWGDFFVSGGVAAAIYPGCGGRDVHLANETVEMTRTSTEFLEMATECKDLFA